MRIKILPVTIIACGVLIIAKSIQVSQDLLIEKPSQTVQARNIILHPPVIKKSEPKLKVAKVENIDDVIDIALAEPAAGEEKKGKDKVDAEELPPNVHEAKPEESIPKFSDSDKQVLEKLSARRTELDEWQKNLEMKEQLLAASSKKLDNKLDELKKLKSDTETLLSKYSEKEDEKITSLVKVYENMKPKDAASIFEEMDMSVLLQIADKMSERKISAILAGMTAKKAKDVTEELAKRQTLPTSSSAAEPKQTASVQ